MIAGIASLNAQDRKNKATVGVKGGYNVSSVSFDGTSETAKLHGFHIGVYGESYFGKYFSIQPEIIYSQQGYKIIDENGTYTQKLDYINVPLMLKLYPVKSFFIEAGPQIGFSISHKETFDSGFILYKQIVNLNSSIIDKKGFTETLDKPIFKVTTEELIKISFMSDEKSGANA